MDGLKMVPARELEPIAAVVTLARALKLARLLQDRDADAALDIILDHARAHGAGRASLLLDLALSILDPHHTPHR
jgi:hypothetical protein